MFDSNQIGLVDFHCHLDLYPDMRIAYERCEKLRCTTFAVTTTPKAYARNCDFAARTKYVHAALGLHPQLVSERSSEIGLFEELSVTTRYIGEIGLDAGKRHYPSFDLQRRIFDRALSICAHQGDKIISVHSVRCARHVLDAIERNEVIRSCKVVLHWFSASKADIGRAVDLGCWFSVNQQMLSTPNGRALLDRAPKDRLLTETDGPFLEVDGIGLKAGDVAKAIELISDALNISNDDVRFMIQKNADRVLA